MEYTVSRLAKLSGVSARTLRYYDGKGLLRPEKIKENGYRVYTEKQVGILQQILFFRELGFPLDEIKRAVCDSDFDAPAAMQKHLCALEKEQRRLALLCENVRKTIKSLKGESSMTDEEKFEGFKKAYIDENENKFGKELRVKFGDSVVDGYNKRIMDMDKMSWDDRGRLTADLEKQLITACGAGSPTSEEAAKLFEMHRKWLCLYWGDENYSAEAHASLAEGYIEDKRFKAYYDGICPNGAQFMHDVIIENCKNCK